MHCGENSRRVFHAIVMCMLYGTIAVCPATAAITTTGSIDPIYDATDPWNVAGTLKIGATADGTLEIADGSNVVSSQGQIAAVAGSTASAHVTGSGSQWLSGGIYAGDLGDGTLTLDGGGTLVAWDLTAGRTTGSAGHVIITGPGTSWQGRPVRLVYPLDSSIMSVDGSTGTEMVATIGRSGIGDMTISNGATAMADRGLLYLGYGSYGVGSLTITGQNSAWGNTGTAYVGRLGVGTLLISDGGTMTSGRAGVNYRSTATVTGLGSVWRIDQRLYVGWGDEARLIISDGGRVESGYAVAYAALIAGPGSVWQNEGQIVIGEGSYGWMRIENGARVTDANAYVGWGAFGSGFVQVSGAGSQWITTGTVRLGGGPAEPGLTADGAGTLRVIDGGLAEAGDVMVSEHGAIEGDGTLRTGMLTTWGTIRPGSSIGTLTIDGNVAMEPNSVLDTEIDNAGHGDKLLVTGDVNIVGGAVRAVPVGAITRAQQYTIVEANSVSGRFDTVDISLLGSAQSRIATFTYGPDSVVLTVTPFDGIVGQTQNQQSLGTALQSIAEAGGTAITGGLQQLQTLDAVRASYDQLCGQSRPPLAPIAATDSAKFMGIVSNRLQGARGTVADSLGGLSDSPLLAMASPDDRMDATVTSDAGWNAPGTGLDTGRYSDDLDWGVWGKLYGLFGDRETEHGTPGYSYNAFGQSFGVDLQLTERFIGGITGGYSDARVDYDRLADTADIGATHAGLYGSYSADGWYLNYVATHSWLNLDTRRVVDLTGERHEGSFDGYEWSGYAEAGFDWQPAASWLVQPLAGLQVTYLHLDEYAETGLASALVYEEQDYESYKGSLGVRVTKELVLGSHGRVALVQGRARWVHEFGDTTSSVDARFEDVPDVFFTVSDEEVSRDTILLGTGIGVRLTRGLRAFVDYDASLNPDNTAQIISGAVEYRW